MKKLVAVLTIVGVLFLAFSVKTNAVSNTSKAKIEVKIDDTIVGSKCNGEAKEECKKKCDGEGKSVGTKECDGKSKAECEKKCDEKSKADGSCCKKDGAKCEGKDGTQSTDGTQCKSAKKAKKVEGSKKVKTEEDNED